MPIVIEDLTDDGNDREVEALAAIAAAMADLDRATRDRVASWVFDRYTTPAEETS